MNIAFASSASMTNTAWEYTGNAQQGELVENGAQMPIAQGDRVQFNSNYAEATLLDDAETENVLSDSMQYITKNPESALYAHQGLDASRVAALLS